MDIRAGGSRLSVAAKGMGGLGLTDDAGSRQARAWLLGVSARPGAVTFVAPTCHTTDGVTT